MSLSSRFFGKREKDDAGEGGLVANPALKHPLSLQLLFADTCPTDTACLVRELRSFHPSMAQARCELDPGAGGNGNLFGMVGWGRHVVRCVGLNAPMPAEVVESCVAPSHYPQELKERARSHQAHLLLYYVGYEASPFEQYVALAALCGVLARLGALVVLNESAHTSFPAVGLAGGDGDGDIMELLRTLPLPILYCGFVKHEVQGIPGVWMRTYGAPLLGLPDFAVHAAGHHEGHRYFDIFDSVLGYLRGSGATLAAGHTMQLGEEEYLRFRAPGGDEPFLSIEGCVDPLVVEIIGPDEVNR